MSPTSNAEEAAGPAVTAASLFTSLQGCQYRRHCQPYSWVALPVQQMRSNDSGDDVVMMMGGRCSLAHASQLQTRLEPVLTGASVTGSEAPCTATGPDFAACLVVKH
jgi:hypothetical protein